MRFSGIMKALKDMDAVREVCRGADREIYSIKMIEGTEEYYHPNILYFGYYEQIEDPLPPQSIICAGPEEAEQLRARFSNRSVSIAAVQRERFGYVFNFCTEQMEYHFHITSQERLIKRFRSLPEGADAGMAFCVPTRRTELFPTAEKLLAELEDKVPFAYAIRLRRGMVVMSDIAALRHDRILLSVIPPECRPQIGISNEIVYEKRIEMAYQEAVEALNVGVRLWPEMQVYAYAEISLYNLLRDAKNRNELDRYMSPNIARLEAYDAETGAHLTETLLTYLQHNGNIKETARILYLHRNTVIYRLDKIRQITRLDLDDAKIRFLLLFGFAAMLVREKFA